MRNGKSKIALVLIATVLLVSFGMVSFGTIAKAQKLEDVKKECQRTIPTSTEQYASGYLSSGATASLSGVVTDAVLQNLTTVKLTEEEINKLNDGIAQAIDMYLGKVSLDLTAEETELLKAGIQALALSNVYKAIAGDGSIDAITFNMMRKTLEDRITACEAVVAAQSKEVSATITTMEEYIAAMNESDNVAKLADMSSEINNLIQWIEELDMNSDTQESDLAYLETALDSLEKKLETSGAVDIVTLKKSVEDIKTLLKNGAVTTDQLNTLSSFFKGNN